MAKTARRPRKSDLRNAILADVRLTASALRLGCAILERISTPGGCCDASLVELQATIGACSRRTVQRALDELVAGGHFVVDRSKGGRGPGSTHRIRLPLEEAADARAA